VSTAPQRVVESPQWFGPSEHRLFGWVTWPSAAPVRGGVLLAPPIGREARAARRAFRQLAASLADRGFASLRFDYDGTGDSSGTFDDPGHDVAWTESVQHAAAYLRSLGVSSVAAVGMRLGATIVGTAAGSRDLGLTSLVLWDPCETGRSYLRELGALESLRRSNFTADQDGGVETAEFVFTPEAAGELRRLSLSAAATTALAERVLVISRDDRAVSEKLRRRLADEKVDWETTSEQPALVNVEPLKAAMPLATMRSIVTWIASQPTEPQAFDAPGPAGPAVMRLRGVANPVAERFVVLGPRELFGIVTEPVGDAHGPLIAMFNVSNEEHTGPSRLWVELSRRWAGLGLRCVRFDLTGLGDSPRVARRSDGSMYDQAWLEDLPEVARLLHPEDPSDTVFVGLCSGAYLAAEAGLELHARGVCAINPPIGVDFLSGIARLERSRHAWVRTLAVQLKEVALRLRWVSIVIWHVARVIMPSVFSHDLMSMLVDNGTDLLVLSSSENLSPYPQVPQLDKFFSARLVAPSNYEVAFVPGLDHSMHAAVGRDRAVALLDAHVQERYAGISPRTDAQSGTKEGS
jgi:alpha/beta superfamily hydrolase